MINIYMTILEIILQIEVNQHHIQLALFVLQLFQQRPVWSRTALNSFYTGKLDKLKYLLPLVSFYYLNGPWRCQWVRFGYDPRKHPEAKMYQIVDYRARQSKKKGWNGTIYSKHGYGEL